MVANPTMEEHIVSLREVFTVMREYGFVLNLEKCKFGVVWQAPHLLFTV